MTSQHTNDAGVHVLVFLLVLIVLTTVLLIGSDKYAEATRADGYRRGYCEGRGGVEATVHDSIQCIQPPETVRTK